MYRIHYPRVVRALELSGASRGEAEEAAQEAFARTLGHWRRVRRGSNPAGYVYRVAFRLGRRRRFVEIPIDDLATSRAAPGSGDLADHVALSLDVEQAFEAMPSARRAAAILCMVVGLTPKEAGMALGIAGSTVRKQLARAREDLRLALAEPLE